MECKTQGAFNKTDELGVTEKESHNQYVLQMWPVYQEVNGGFKQDADICKEGKRVGVKALQKEEYKLSSTCCHYHSTLLFTVSGLCFIIVCREKQTDTATLLGEGGGCKGVGRYL